MSSSRFRIVFQVFIFTTLFLHHLRIDHEGNIWVADFGLHIVQKFTPEGKLLQTLGVRGEKGEDETHFNMPTDMAITKSGDIYGERAQKFVAVRKR